MATNGKRAKWVREQCTLKGETWARSEIATPSESWSVADVATMKEFLAQSKDRREHDSQSRRDALSRKTLYIATAAMIIAAIAAHKEIAWLVSSVIKWVP